MLALAAIFALAVFGRQADRPAQAPIDDFCVVAPATPYDPAAGLPMLAPRPVPAEARCPVCGMYPARSPRWAGQILFRDGAAQFFDSPIDLFAFLQKIGRYNRSYALDDVAARFVSDFETGGWIALESAFFVHGSAAPGPMRGGDLPAFGSREAAGRFASKQGGRVLAFSQVTPELVASLNRNVRHRH